LRPEVEVKQVDVLAEFEQNLDVEQVVVVGSEEGLQVGAFVEENQLHVGRVPLDQLEAEQHLVAKHHEVVDLRVEFSLNLKCFLQLHLLHLELVFHDVASLKFCRDVYFNIVVKLLFHVHKTLDELDIFPKQVELVLQLLDKFSVHLRIGLHNCKQFQHRQRVA